MMPAGSVMTTIPLPAVFRLPDMVIFWLFIPKLPLLPVTLTLPATLNPDGSTALLMKLRLVARLDGRLGLTPLKVVLDTCQRPPIVSVRLPAIVTATPGLLVAVAAGTLASTMAEPLTWAALVKLTPAALAKVTSWK